MLISLNLNVPRYFVEHLLGQTALGHYAALAYFVSMGGLVLNSVGQALSPRLAERAAARDRRGFFMLQARFALIAVGIGTAGLGGSLVAGRPLLRLIYGAEYAEHVDVLVWLFVAGAVSYLVTVLDYGMMARRLFLAMPLMQAMIVAVNTLACLILVPRYGMRAAAWSWLTALLVQGGCEAWLVLVSGWQEPVPSGEAV
jgi:O-antigen/teichoic acid export membrane protein